MGRRSWFAGLFVALIVISLLVLGGVAIHRAGWAQGYAMGQLGTGEEGEAPVPYAPHAFGPWGYSYRGRYVGHSPVLRGLGLLAGIGGLILVGKLIFGLVVFRHLRPWKWAFASGDVPEGAQTSGQARARWARAQSRRWRMVHGHMPPWMWGAVPPCYGGRETPEEDTGEPAAEAPEAETED